MSILRKSVETERGEVIRFSLATNDETMQLSLMNIDGEETVAYLTRHEVRAMMLALHAYTGARW